MLSERIGESQFLKLKADFLQMLKTCPTTTLESSRASLPARFEDFFKMKGWGHVIRTNVEELVERRQKISADQAPTSRQNINSRQSKAIYKLP